MYHSEGEDGARLAPVAALASLIRDATAGEDLDLELAVFGCDDADTIAGALCDFLRARLAPVEDARFYRRSVGVVAGVLLSDGREVVVKVHRWNVSIARLRAVQQVQAHLAGTGLPAPRPLCPPEPLRSGIATVEELRGGDFADGHRTPVRRALAEGLREFIVAAQSFRTLADLGPPLIVRPPGEPLWPEPHDLRFDFEATSEGAEWIDDLAVVAQRRLRGVRAAPMAGHFDWCIGNLGFERDRIVAIYDWDSVAIAPEPVIVGAAAAHFSADWGRSALLPQLDEMRAFVEEYEQAREALFDARERTLLDGANLAQCAYGARCQHSDMRLDPARGDTSAAGWIALLRERQGQGLMS